VIAVADLLCFERSQYLHTSWIILIHVYLDLQSLDEKLVIVHYNDAFY
jgi:hypothetical protein